MQQPNHFGIHTHVRPQTEPLPWEWLKSNRYALVGGEYAPDIPESWQAQPIVAKGFEDIEHWMPRLVDLTVLSEATLSGIWAVIEAQHQPNPAFDGPWINALIDTDLSSEHLFNHLRRIQVWQFRDSPAWMRVHDSRVWLQLPRVVGAGRWLHLLHAKTRRWSVYYDGQWVDTQAPQPLPKPVEPTILFSASPNEWNHLNLMGHVNHLLAVMGWTALADMRLHSAHLQALLLQAQERWGLHTLDDLTIYARLGATLRLEFEQHPIMQGLIQHLSKINAQASPMGLEHINMADLIKRISANDKAQLQRDYAQNDRATLLTR